MVSANVSFLPTNVNTTVSKIQFDFVSPDSKLHNGTCFEICKWKKGGNVGEIFCLLREKV